MWRSARLVQRAARRPRRELDRCYSYHSNSSSLEALSLALPSDNNDSEHSNLYRRMLHEPKKKTGFDQFFPPKKDQDKNDDDKQDDDSKSHKEDNNDDKNKNDNQNNNNNNSNLWGTLGLVALAMYLYQRNSPSHPAEGGGSDREAPPPISESGEDITWHDLHELLESNQIEKLIVSSANRDNVLARVVLKPGAPGLQQHNLRGRFRRRSSPSGPSDEPHPDEEHHHREVVEGLGTTSSSSPDQRPQSLLNRTYGTSTVYRLFVGSVDTLEDKLSKAQDDLGIPYKHHVPVQFTPDSTVASELLGVFPSFLLMAIVYGMIMRSGAAGGAGGGGGGIFQIGKSTAKKINKEQVNVTFANVAGCQEAKKEIMEFVDFLQDATRFTKLGAKIPKGALLCGPPGTGKTLLAKAVAGEANVPFFSISGSDFIEMFVGVGPSRVRDLFKEARANAPCIVFIDEIDAVGRQRGRGGVGGNDERENTLNQLLVEMDGFSPSTGVVVLAGTNRVDILDQALTRPGRFDRQIQVDKPDLRGRREIFMVHLEGIKLEEDAENIAGRLAGLTPGFAGADIANICNEAAIVAARRKAESVSMEDFEKATDRIIGGLESNKIMSKEERSIVAHHEAGHAVAGWFLEHADPLLKVTIIPRSSGALGYAQYLPKELFLRTREQIMDTVCMALAGRAAEEIFFGRVTTGASDDLRRVTDIVYSTIQLYGMNPRLGQLAFPKDPNAMFDERPYSDATAKAMDEEAKSIVDAAYQRTLDLLGEKKDAVEQVAAKLLDQETITHDDVVELLGDRPFKRDTAYDEFVKRKKTVFKSDEEDENKDTEDEEEASVDGTGPLNPGLV